MAKEAREWAQATGDLPHEILLNIARGKPVCIPKIDPKTGLFVIGEDDAFERVWLSPGLQEVMDAAKAAAPYFAPKISTVEVITGVSDDELDAIIARSAAEAGLSVGTGGEGQEGESPASSAAGSRPRTRLADDDE